MSVAEHCSQVQEPCQGNQCVVSSLRGAKRGSNPGSGMIGVRISAFTKFA
ncbi:MAG: hypothetical protein I8H72_01300 [Myxococcaceae bacterium]|nr:hypothetical protein [Myxococcaceae bacterium]